MNTYRITAETATGETISQTIIESSEAKARKAFRMIYRHGEDYTITDAELIAENSSATKQQERDAIEKVKAILETLGPQSYVATALAGCLEDAENNIEDDAAYSMKDRWELAESRLAAATKKLTQFDLDNRDLRLALEKAKQEAADAQQALRDLRGKIITAADLTDCMALVEARRNEIDENLEAAAASIVKFADNPSGPDFQRAVKEHRRLDSEKTYCYNLAARLEAVQQAADVA